MSPLNKIKQKQLSHSSSFNLAWAIVLTNLLEIMNLLLTGPAKNDLLMLLSAYNVFKRENFGIKTCQDSGQGKIMQISQD